jgi:hypothetical protein
MADPPTKQQATLAGLWAAGPPPSSATATTATTRPNDENDTSRGANTDEDPRWQGAGWRIAASEPGCPYNVRSARVPLYARPSKGVDAAASDATATATAPPPSKRRRTGASQQQQQQQQLTLDSLIVFAKASAPRDRRREREQAGTATATAAPRPAHASRPCPECGMMYARGHTEDERVHAQYHARAVEGKEGAGEGASVLPPPPPDGITLPVPSSSSSSSSFWPRELLRYDLPPPPKRTAPSAAASFFGSRRPLGESGGSFLAQRAQQQQQQKQGGGGNGRAAPSPSSSCRIVAVLPHDPERPLRRALDAARRAGVLPTTTQEEGAWSALLLHLDASGARATAALAVRAGVAAERGGFNSNRRPAARGTPVFLGVVGMWVAPNLRRRRVATRLLDAARAAVGGGVGGGGAGAPPPDRARVAVSRAAVLQLPDAERRKAAAFFRFYCGVKEEDDGGDARLAVF